MASHKQPKMQTTREELPDPMTRTIRRSLCHELISFRLAVTTWYKVMDTNTTTPRMLTNTDNEASRVWLMLAPPELPGRRFFRFPTVATVNTTLWQAAWGSCALHEGAWERENEGHGTARIGLGSGSSSIVPSVECTKTQEGYRCDKVRTRASQLRHVLNGAKRCMDGGGSL